MSENPEDPAGSGRRFCLVVSRYNRVITDRLVAGARDALLRRGARPEDIDVVRVPGAWELAAAVRQASRAGYDAVVALGCVVRGETPHFDYICQGATYALSRLAITEDTPIAFGVITADTLEQAIDRAGGKHGNKGTDAARTAIEMANLLVLLSKQG